MSCTPASHTPQCVMVISPGDSPVGEGPPQRRGSRAYQIFPEPLMVAESESDDLSEDGRPKNMRERLPSIVVEPTDMCEGESEQLCQFPHSQGREEEVEQCLPQTEGSVGREQQDDRISSVRKSSIGPGQCLTSNRLTPPPSPTDPEAAPPGQGSWPTSTQQSKQ